MGKEEFPIFHVESAPITHYVGRIALPGEQTSSPNNESQPLISQEEADLAKMIRRALGGGDRGIRTKPQGVRHESYHRNHHFRRKGH